MIEDLRKEGIQSCETDAWKIRKALKMEDQKGIENA
jgi:hypothetical protein